MKAASQVPSGVLISTLVSTTCCASAVPAAAAVRPAAAMPTKPRRVMSSLLMLLLLWVGVPVRCDRSAVRPGSVHGPLIILRMTPARWLTDHVHLLPPGGLALDVACGRGRHALWLAAHGSAVVALDRD